jgi:hypothetical protein
LVHHLHLIVARSVLLKLLLLYLLVVMKSFLLIRILVNDFRDMVYRLKDILHLRRDRLMHDHILGNLFFVTAEKYLRLLLISLMDINDYILLFKSCLGLLQCCLFLSKPLLFKLPFNLFLFTGFLLLLKPLLLFKVSPLALLFSSFLCSNPLFLLLP